MDNAHPFWARQNPVSDTAECAKVALNTAIDVYEWLRLINDGPVILGGVGVIVQIDESLFKHKPKVRSVQKRFTSVYASVYVCIDCIFFTAVPPRKTG